MQANSDGVNDGGTFNFTLTWKNAASQDVSQQLTRNAWESVGVSTEHLTKDCGGANGVALAVQVPKGKDVTVTEDSGPWNLNTESAADFPKVDHGQSPAFGTNGPAFSISSTANTAGDYLNFQNRRIDRERTLTICKAVDANFDGVNQGGDFTFKVFDAQHAQVGGDQTRTAWESTDGGHQTSDCGGTTVTLLQGKAYTVNESGEPAGWQDDGSLGYPKNDAGGGATANVPGDNNNFKVTFSNRTVDRKVDVQVCKAVIPNNDNLVDGGEFKFTLSQANATDQTFTIIRVEAASGSSCETRSVLENVAWTVTELGDRPGNGGLTGTWTGDDASYPQNSKDGAVKDSVASMAPPTRVVTFTNKMQDRTHTLQVCKVVSDNGDGDSTDGGTFHFEVTGGNPQPASFDLTVAEGSDKCQDVTVLDGFTQSVSETEPSGWIDAKDYPKWTTMAQTQTVATINGSGTSTGEIAGSSISATFTNKARPSQSVTFLKAICPSFEVVPSNNPKDDSFGQNDLPTGYTEADLAAQSPAAGVPVGTDLPDGCTLASGWTFDLFTLGGTPLGSVTTDGTTDATPLTKDQIDALVAGGINVKEETQDGYSFAALKCYDDHQYLDNSENLVLPDAASSATANVNCVAFNVATGSISGAKYDDLNGDGLNNDGGFGLQGWEITATRIGGSPVFTTTTGADGTYSFSDIPQGTYDVCETLQSGWTNTAPLCVQVTVGGGSDATGVDFLNFADATIYNVKVVTNDAADTTDFTAEVTGPEDFTSSAFHQGAPASDIVTHGGDYTSKENTLAGFQYVGTYVGQFGDGHAICPITKPETASTDGATTTVISGAKVVFCHYNVEVGSVQLIKDETHQSAGSETWNFTSAILANPALTTPLNASGPNGPLASSANQVFNNIPVGSYTIAETQGHNICVAGSASTDYQTNGLAAVDAVPNPDPATNVVGSGNVAFTVEKGKQTTIVFENQGCGTVLSTSSLAVKKFADPAANFKGTTLLSGWEFTVSGTTTLGAPLTRTTTTNNVGVALFPDLPDGSYTVTETLQAGWKVVGSKYVIGGSGTQPGLSRDFTIGLEENKEIDFFNQPLVAIKATKLEVVGGTTQAGEGWLITISGCGFSDSQPTGADGSVTFPNLLPCNYTVSEKVDSKPGFAPAGAVTKSVNATTPGQTVLVGFENVALGFCTTCTNVEPTPTPTTVPPTATPTTPANPTATPVPPTATPTIVDITRGEKTPGPGITPIAPNTGNGLFGTSTGSTNMLLALIGAITLGGGLLVLAASRRRRS